MTNAASSTQEQVTISAKDHERFIKLMEKEEKAKAYAKRSAAKQALLARKAKEYGFEVFDEEIDEYLSKGEAA